jgi:hypothetical protein
VFADLGAVARLDMPAGRAFKRYEFVVVKRGMRFNASLERRTAAFGASDFRRGARDPRRYAYFGHMSFLPQRSRMAARGQGQRRVRGYVPYFETIFARSNDAPCPAVKAAIR